MTKTGTMWIAVVAMLGCVPAVRAAPESSAGGRRATREWPTPDEVVSRLDARLSLSEDQEARIKPIVAARQERMKALAGDTSSGRRQKARSARAIWEDSDLQIEAVLNGAQKQEYARVKAEMREEARARMRQRAG